LFGYKKGELKYIGLDMWAWLLIGFNWPAFFSHMKLECFSVRGKHVGVEEKSYLENVRIIE
jgi:hypothetical protein